VLPLPFRLAFPFMPRVPPLFLGSGSRLRFDEEEAEEEEEEEEVVDSTG
jgi:hypothetical protein